MTLKTLFQVIIGTVGYIAWAVMAYLDPSLRADFLKFNIAMAVGTIGLVLRDMQTPNAPPTNKESGHALPAMLVVLAAMSTLLSGCASFQQAYAGYQTSAINGAQAFNDNVITTWSTAACATPFSAAIRNPQIIPALKALCLPGGAAAGPATLLDSISTAKGVAPAAADTK